MAKWLEICLQTTAAEVEALAARLTLQGLEGLVIEDEADFLRFLEDNRQYWDYVDEDLRQRMKGAARVKFYQPDSGEGRRQIEEFTRGLTGVQISVTTLEEDDWANGWKQFYKPMAVGERLYVVPEWEQGEIPAGRVPLILNPGLTFGTGSHASTQLCLEGVEEYTKLGDRVLDLGCGSGILSIAAVNLGAKDAVCVDIDPKAVDVAYENAAMNGIGRDRYTVRAGDVLSDGSLKKELCAQKYELVLANIVADVIIALAPHAQEFLAPGGHFLCSGVIDTRGDEVAAVLAENGLVIVSKKERGGWVAFVCKAD
ncbi:MAG: 50S ribosomal protein L11 methyltransferase [Oscillospiraceae bacterium]